MAITLYHHPYSRASGTIWALEELGVDYELCWVDMMAGETKKPEMLALNPMGKLPTLVDGETVVTESAAINLYLADRYGLGTLAPEPSDPRRGTYLRWSLFAPSVIEPGLQAKVANWDFKPGSAGWGTHEAMLGAMESALDKREFLLGDMFSMADVIFGGTVRFMLQFEMLEKKPAFVEYAERLAKRPALQRADARNAAVAKEHDLSMG